MLSRQQRTLSYVLIRCTYISTDFNLHRHIASPANHDRIRHHRDVVLLQILLVLLLLLLVDRVEIRHRRYESAASRERVERTAYKATTTRRPCPRLFLSNWARSTTRGRDAIAKRVSSLTFPPRWASGSLSRSSRRDDPHERRSSSPRLRVRARPTIARLSLVDNDNNRDTLRQCLRINVSARVFARCTCTTCTTRTADICDVLCVHSSSIFYSLRFQACQRSRARTSCQHCFSFEWHKQSVVDENIDGIFLPLLFPSPFFHQVFPSIICNIINVAI